MVGVDISGSGSRPLAEQCEHGQRNGLHNILRISQLYDQLLVSQAPLTVELVLTAVSEFCFNKFGFKPQITVCLVKY
jgi:hypothetical protein